MTVKDDEHRRKAGAYKYTILCAEKNMGIRASHTLVTLPTMPQIKTKAVDLLKTATSGEPILNLHRSVAAETLWPTTLQSEADKAARILRSFFIDGFIIPYRTLGKCPQRVLRVCSGLAILHVLRSGLHSPSASGSGVVVSQSSAGKWSGASAILVDFDLPPGVDVADIVIVLNHENHLDALSSPNVMLGKALKIESGPMPQSDTLSGQLHNMPHATDRAFIYAKSQGQLVELDLGTMIVRTADEENERFYGVHGVSQTQILSGQVGTPFDASDHLCSTLDALTQQSMHMSDLPGSGKCPGDCRVKAPVTTEA